VPYTALAIGISILIGALFIRGSKQVREIVAAVPQSQLVAGSNSTASSASRFWFFMLLGSCPESLLYPSAGVTSWLA
jgi:hypothetical protein